jgi:hypothetical protein
MQASVQIGADPQTLLNEQVKDASALDWRTGKYFKWFGNVIFPDYIRFSNLFLISSLYQ